MYRLILLVSLMTLSLMGVADTDVLTGKKEAVQKEKQFAPFTGPLSILNVQFHQAYNQAVIAEVAQIKAGKIPVMIMSSGYLTFYFQGIRRQVKVVPDLYHEIKAVDHMVLGLYVFLSRLKEGPLSTEILQSIQSKKEEIERAYKDFQPEIKLDFQVRILEQSLNYLNSLLNDKLYNLHGLLSYIQSMRTALEASFLLAAKSQLDLMHQYVSQWKKNMSATDWSALKVVVCASHQPRYGELSYSYFSRLLDEKPTVGALGEDQIIYSESRYSEDEALSLLARHIIDQQISQTFFNDRFRMQRDLFNDVTESYLNEILPM
ncbi:hypothetical protein [Shewanella surugensis]|uniref:Uncharacterized protein n=1 Tax=Shewanella surugensis TaxID=212020 RepID=A0ABT0LDE7_9GAMM|nr:hypothetical protein [Shewanella surugensis]MCL1125352.1 hypothetical protein [Shewanella surugensis]